MPCINQHTFGGDIEHCYACCIEGMNCCQCGSQIKKEVNGEDK